MLVTSPCLAQGTPGPSSGAKMPALHIEDLPEKEKLKMEVEQLRKEVKLQRQQVRWPAIPEFPLRNINNVRISQLTGLVFFWQLLCRSLELLDDVGTLLKV